jgi:hypothetical protein
VDRLPVPGNRREVPSRESPLLCVRQPFAIQFTGELI